MTDREKQKQKMLIRMQNSHIEKINLQIRMLKQVSKNQNRRVIIYSLQS